jgi:glycosyltransferase involved in cell wall biosynthesis
MKVLIVREKWNHMSKVSGFDPLFIAFSKLPNVFVSSVYIHETNIGESKTSKILKFVKRFVDAILNRIIKPFGLGSRVNANIQKPKIRISTATHLVHELTFDRVLNVYKQNEFDFVIFSVADSQFGEGLYHASKEFKKKSILFFHQPPSWLKLNWRDFEILNDFAAIVILSESNKRFFQTQTNIPVFLIKHGVDLSFFNLSNKNGQRHTKHILFVGSWLRDFEMLLKVTHLLNQENFDFVLNCIIPRKDRHNMDLIRLGVYTNVNFYADLSAEELREAYQSNDLFFLPLIDSTANNGMNEALACGLPVVATNIGGVPDYLLPPIQFLAEPNNPADHVAKIKLAFEWMNQNSDYKNKTRQHAEQHLNWNEIARELKENIESLASSVL